jgi:hypothetical protein
MKAGDIVQVLQRDGGTHWIYATVITPNDDGSAFVQIRHNGNVDHEKMLFFAAGQIRTSADVQKLIDSMPPKAGGEVLAEKKSLQNQLEWLT